MARAQVRGKRTKVHGKARLDARMCMSHRLSCRYVHVRAGTCSYVHIKNLSTRPSRSVGNAVNCGLIGVGTGTILGSFDFFQRISACSAYFNLEFIFTPGMTASRMRGIRWTQIHIRIQRRVECLAAWLPGGFASIAKAAREDYQVLSGFVRFCLLWLLKDFSAFAVRQRAALFFDNLNTWNVTTEREARAELGAPILWRAWEAKRETWPRTFNAKTQRRKNLQPLTCNL